MFTPPSFAGNASWCDPPDIPPLMATHGGRYGTVPHLRHGRLAHAGISQVESYHEDSAKSKLDRAEQITSLDRQALQLLQDCGIPFNVPDFCKAWLEASERSERDKIHR